MNVLEAQRHNTFSLGHQNGIPKFQPADSASAHNDLPSATLLTSFAEQPAQQSR